MLNTKWLAVAAAAGLGWACNDPAASPLRSDFSAAGRPAVLVNPNSGESGTARTIQQGINLAAAGGTVLVLPGTYRERIVIDRGITLEGIAGDRGDVLLEELLDGPAPSGADAVVQIATRESVVLRNITVHHVGLRGINAFGATDLTVARVTLRGEFPFPAPFFNNGVSSVNNAGQSGARSRLTIRESDFQVAGIAMAIGGDVDAVVERNRVDHSATNSGCVNVSPTGQGVTVPAGAETNVAIVDNVFIDCGAVLPGIQNFSLGILGTAGAATGGTVDIVGNTIRNTTRTAPSCNTTAVQYEHYTGRIERNTIENAVAPCAPTANRAFPGAVFVGSRLANIRPAVVIVRYNDIAGNAFAGLRIGANQREPLHAECNYWGSADGPAGLGPGTGDAIVVEPGGAAPVFAPFATEAIAGTSRVTC